MVMLPELLLNVRLFDRVIAIQRLACVRSDVLRSHGTLVPGGRRRGWGSVAGWPADEIIRGGQELAFPNVRLDRRPPSNSRRAATALMFSIRRCCCRQWKRCRSRC